MFIVHVLVIYYHTKFTEKENDQKEDVKSLNNWTFEKPNDSPAKVRKENEVEYRKQIHFLRNMKKGALVTYWTFRKCL